MKNYPSSFYQKAAAFARGDAARFFTPGHKGAPLAPFGDALRFDLTEIEGFDSLYDSEGILRESEEYAAGVYGCGATLFSAGGSSLCIQAMLRAFFRAGDRVVCSRVVHSSAVNAMALLGLEPEWVWPEESGGVSLSAFRAALDACPQAAGIYLTSPDYYGRVADLAGLSDLCRERGKILLVDNAHGAHLKLFGAGLHPMEHPGVTACCDSAHKTLPALTGGAWLHLRDGADFHRTKAAMKLFGSTSPSYLVLLSLDQCAHWLAEEGRDAFIALARRVEQIKQTLSAHGYRFEEGLCDPARLTVSFASAGVSDPCQKLREAGIVWEYFDGDKMVFLLSPFNPPPHLERLEQALLSLPLGEAVTGLSGHFSLRPERAMSLRRALEADSETVAPAACVGKIAASPVSVCPPGTPLVMPGERMDEKMKIVLQNAGIRRVNVIK